MKNTKILLILLLVNLSNVAQSVETEMTHRASHSYVENHKVLILMDVLQSLSKVYTIGPLISRFEKIKGANLVVAIYGLGIQLITQFSSSPDEFSEWANYFAGKETVDDQIGRAHV